MDQVWMDLGDFVPEEYEFGFAIQKEKYRFKYAEASVDDVLRLLLNRDEKEDHIATARRVVSVFLSKVCVEGDPEKLRKGLELLPYKSAREGLDIQTLYNTINSRVKKNDLGVTEQKTA